MSVRRAYRNSVFFCRQIGQDLAMAESDPVQNDFTHVELPYLQKRVLRLGIAGNYGLTPDDIRYAAERGANYWLWGATFTKVTAPLREILKGDRDQHVVAFLGSGVWGGQVRRAIERTLKKLDTDYIDVFKLGWLGRTSRYGEGIIDVLLKLKEEGKIRAIGCSIHDRPRAGRLAEDSPLDVFMIRYNAKHPGAEKDIFPHLEARKPAVVAYTATAWRQLIRPVKGIDVASLPADGGMTPPMTAGLCYRFCLSSPHVHAVLTGPKDRSQLDENFLALNQGPLSDVELAWVREYGRQLKNKRKLDYV